MNRRAYKGVRNQQGTQTSPTSVVFVCLVYSPDSSATSLLFTDLFSHMAASGRAVTVLCGFPTKGSAGQLRSIPRRETIGGVDVVRCGLRVLGKRTILMRLLVYLSFLLHAGWKLMRGYRGSRLVGGTDPPFTPVGLYFLSLLRRRSYDVILLDLYPDGLVALGRLRDFSWITRAWRALNRLSYARANRLIVIGRDMIPLLERRYGVPRNRPIYIPHWATSEIDRQADVGTGSLLVELNLQHKFVVQYSGNMGLWHDIETLVQAAIELRENENIHFLFIGDGMRRPAAQSLAEAHGLTNITWLDLLPRERLTETLTSCNAALISFRAGLEGVAVPSKLYGILASGTPVIAQVPEQSEVARVIREESCGTVVPPDDAPALAEAIRLLATNPSMIAHMKARAWEAYRRKYTIAHAAESFAAVWDS